jgi:hypothetical protein
MRTVKWYEEKIQEHTEAYKRHSKALLIELKKCPTTEYGKQVQKEECEWHNMLATEAWKLIKRYEKKLAEVRN